MSTKRENRLNPLSCWGRAEQDEPVFVLLGRDTEGQVAIRAWIKARVAAGKNRRSDSQLKEARRCIVEFDQWQAALESEKWGKKLEAEAKKK